MKHFRSRTIFSFLLLTLFLVSCKKDRDEQQCQPNVAGISGNYKITSLQYKMTSTSTPVDYLVFMDDCEKDDLIILKADGTYQSNDIGLICTPNNSNSGTWSISGNTIISDGVVAGTIETFDCNKLVCFLDDVNVPGDRFTLTVTRQ